MNIKKTLIIASMIASAACTKPEHSPRQDLNTHTIDSIPMYSESGGAIATGDINGDGNVDFVAAARPTGGSLDVYAFMNDGQGNFTKRYLVSVPIYSESTGAIALADINHDGSLDLIVGARPSGGKFTLYKFLNDGQGNFR